MSCRRASCYCQSFKQSSSKWSKSNCHSCNHPQKEHAPMQPSKTHDHKTQPITPSVLTQTHSYNLTKNIFTIGDKLDVLYENVWWKAEIINTINEKIEITYDEWDENSNEWINKTSKRLKQNMNNITKKTNIVSKPKIINGNGKYSSVALLKQKYLSCAASNKHTHKKHVRIIRNSLSNGDCSLCAGTNLSNIIILSSCKHKLCKDCMKNYVIKTCTDKLNVKCPFCCNSMDRYKDIKAALSHQEFYDIYLKPNLKKCLSANCDNTIKLIGTGVARLDCSKCDKSWCVNCNVAWHENMDCEAYKQTGQYILEEQQFKHFLNENKESIKKCPKCSVSIEKNNGCNHMHCVSCNIHFCWKCLFSAGDGGSIYTHMTTCR